MFLLRGFGVWKPQRCQVNQAEGTFRSYYHLLVICNHKVDLPRASDHLQ